MKDFFKKFGLGILYLFILPFGLVFVVLFSVVGLGMVLFLFFKSVILFFQGRKLKIELPEDEQAAKIMEAQRAEILEKSANDGYNKPQVQTQTINHTTNIFNNYSDQLMSVFNQAQMQQDNRSVLEQKPDVIDNQMPQIEEKPLILEDKHKEVSLEEAKDENIVDLNLNESDIVDSQYVPLTPKEESYTDENEDDNNKDDEGIDIEYGD